MPQRSGRIDEVVAARMKRGVQDELGVNPVSYQRRTTGYRQGKSDAHCWCACPKPLFDFVPIIN
jgi:hypothetical protein